jgi:hypothetical protein
MSGPGIGEPWPPLRAHIDSDGVVIIGCGGEGPRWAYVLEVAFPPASIAAAYARARLEALGADPSAVTVEDVTTWRTAP